MSFGVGSAVCVVLCGGPPLPKYLCEWAKPRAQLPAPSLPAPSSTAQHPSFRNEGEVAGLCGAEITGQFDRSRAVLDLMDSPAKVLNILQNLG